MNVVDRVLGCDVSHWQDEISTPQRVDFSRMISAGARFVFIKASQGTWADRDILYNWQAAKDAGMYRGAYHYFDWQCDSEKQARFFAGLLREDPGELPPVFDYEMRSGAPDRTAAIARAQAFIHTVEDVLGKPVMIYTSPGYWREYGSYTLVGNRKLWLAHYYTDAPAVPREWVDWKFWQYTDRGDGLRFGVESRELDMNWYNGNWDQFVAEFGELAAEPPVPDPEPAPIGITLTVEIAAVNVRTDPSLKSAIVNRLHKGQQITAEAVHVEDGNRVWVKHQLGWSALVFDGRKMMQGCHE